MHDVIFDCGGSESQPPLPGPWSMIQDPQMWELPKISGPNLDPK